MSEHNNNNGDLVNDPGEWTNTYPLSVPYTSLNVDGDITAIDFGNVCRVGDRTLGGLTMGYWKNHKIDITAVLNTVEADANGCEIILGSSASGHCIKVTKDALDIFNAGAACKGNCHNMLDAQYMAAQLNAVKFDGAYLSAIYVGSGPQQGQLVADVFTAADDLISLLHDNDLTNDPTKEQIVAVKDELNVINNNGETGSGVPAGLCAVPVPPPPVPPSGLSN